MVHTDPSTPPASMLRPAVYAVTFSVGAIITSEMLPASQLTLIARDLSITTGLAGQSITATAFAAIATSLLIARVIGRTDRRRVLLLLSALMTASNVLSALAPSFAFLALARVLLGVSLGGFWALAPSIALRLAPPAQVGRTLAVMFSGISIALVIALPLGTLLGSVLGWRGVFSVAAVIGGACWIWQLAALPTMPVAAETPRHSLLAVLARPQVAAAMLAIFCVFGGRFAFYNYMRPFFEQVTGLSVTSLSAILLLFGIATLVGTSVSGRIMARSLRLALLVAPIVLALSAFGFALAGSLVLPATILTVVWGLANGMTPVSWTTWIARNLPDAAEPAGGLQVAVIQFANIAGSAVGGIAIDHAGALAPPVIAGALFVVAAVIVVVRLRTPSVAPSVAFSQACAA